MFEFFKKKTTKENLEKALAFGLITEEEMLRLELERIQKKLKKFLNKKEK